ncbi:hypothetical protein EI94DRAFT_1751627 [Lactarius quietus]|nr:hypothetical protein EI94DRAFT_1751627 [Lactarius quietus]
MRDALAQISPFRGESRQATLGGESVCACEWMGLGGAGRKVRIGRCGGVGKLNMCRG